MNTDVKNHLTDRNYGIDSLRIISMIMITMLHIIGHGGILDSEKAFSAKYEIIWFIELLAYCSVNNYA